MRLDGCQVLPRRQDAAGLHQRLHHPAGGRLHRPAPTDVHRKHNRFIEVKIKTQKVTGTSTVTTVATNALSLPHQSKLIDLVQSKAQETSGGIVLDSTIRHSVLMLFMLTAEPSGPELKHGVGVRRLSFGPCAVSVVSNLPLHYFLIDFLPDAGAAQPTSPADVAFRKVTLFS